MKYKNKFFLLGLILIVFLSVSCVCAGDNETVTDDPSSDLDLENEDTVVDDNYNAEFIADDYTGEYDSDNEYNLLLINGEGDEITGRDVRLVWDDGKEEPLYEWNDYSGYNTYIDKNAGNYKATVVLKDSYYNAKQVTINVKITKANVKLTPKVYYTTQNNYATMKVTVKDKNGYLVDEGNVKFTINGKSYDVKVKDGVAVKKVKLSKAKTYAYKATFTASNYITKSVTSKVHVYSTSKSARTFKLGKYKYTLSTSKYKKLVNAKNTNKVVYFELKTGKYIKQTYRNYYNNGKYSYKTVNARVILYIAYGGKDGAHGVEANKYSMYFTTRYQYPESFCTPSIVGNKQSYEINKLNKAKIKNYSI